MRYTDLKAKIRHQRVRDERHISPRVTFFAHPDKFSWHDDDIDFSVGNDPTETLGENLGDEEVPTDRSD